MVAFFAEFQIFDINGEDLVRYTRDFMVKVVNIAIRNYLRVVAQRIPVDTGFLRGSHSRINKFFKAKVQSTRSLALERLQTDFDIDETTARAKVQRKKYYTGHGGRIRKTPTSGIRFATAPEQVVTFNNSEIKILLDIDINYYYVMDFFRKGKGTPWKSIDTGLINLFNTIERGINLFPNIDQLVTTVRMSAKGTRLQEIRDVPVEPGMKEARTFSLRGGI